MDLDNKQRYKERYTSKSTRYIKVYHQNIRGLGMKSGEILGHLYQDYPRVLCLTEHHLRKSQIKHKTIENYNLGTYYCRENYEKGVAILVYIHQSIQGSKISIDTYCKEKDLEICVIKFTYHELKISIITRYRFPTGNFDFFLCNLEIVLQKLYNSTLHIIICGDINVDYRVESERKEQLDNLLHSFNLTSIITFPTRVQITQLQQLIIYISTRHNLRSTQ